MDGIYKIIDELYYGGDGTSENESQLLAKYKEIRETLRKFHQLNYSHSQMIERAIEFNQINISDIIKPFD